MEFYYAGKVGRNVASMEYLGGSQKLSRNKVNELSSTLSHSCMIDKGESSSGDYDKYLWFGHSRHGGRYPSNHIIWADLFFYEHFSVYSTFSGCLVALLMLGLFLIFRLK